MAGIGARADEFLEMGCCAATVNEVFPLIKGGGAKPQRLSGKFGEEPHLSVSSLKWRHYLRLPLRPSATTPAPLALPPLIKGNCSPPQFLPTSIQILAHNNPLARAL